MVASPLTSWAWRVRVTVSNGISPDRVSWDKSGMAWYGQAKGGSGKGVLFGCEGLSVVNG